MTDLKICPKCGKVLSYNSYFGLYICNNCKWEGTREDAKPAERLTYEDNYGCLCVKGADNLSEVQLWKI